MSIDVSGRIGRKLVKHTKTDNVLSHWFREDESRIYICPVFRTRTATNTSDLHSWQNSAAFLKRPLLHLCRCCAFARAVCKQRFFTQEAFLDIM